MSEPHPDPHKPAYYKNPFKWCRYYAYKKPNLFFPSAMGVLIPVFLFGFTPLRKKFLFEDVAAVPAEYPLPNRARDASLVGYDDN
ncbi:hypothetical protein BABINDRAFT_37134 [Babjeviella inositovora NRRL Y-12698]|uniref:Uncharacterized protein n=1 Tax=Babjeviella inositovora NRRL Y-12698 TaxID=984486 RepID=A0A1E3QQ00_9ASCO|nr:uncharacterized protein BABINDRAFT_37134 [Babjeviella inositovora NRRL Y-12698]ODQ79544.1 hypothetical protein BABINDRAFT_37134 [Babjeviella inositovora NRRL Y-12698]